MVLISDGTNVYNAASGTSSAIASLSLDSGTAGSPPFAFTAASTSGIYLASAGGSPQVGFTINGTQVGYYTTTGLVMSGTVTALGGISGGTF